MRNTCEISGCNNKTYNGNRYCRYHIIELNKFNGRVAYKGKVISKICSEEGCGKQIKARGLCKSHYNKKYNNRINVICREDGCSKESYKKGLCIDHYNKYCKFIVDSSGKETRICTIEGCTSKHSAKGYCTKHYDELITPNRTENKTVDRSSKSNIITCIVDGCDSLQYKRGLCIKHYGRFKTHGLSDKELFISKFPNIELDPLNIVQAPSKLQPLDKEIALLYQLEILELLSEYKHVIKISRELHEARHKITIIELNRYNHKNQIYIKEILYRLYFKYNMGLIPRTCKQTDCKNMDY